MWNAIRDVLLSSNVTIVLGFLFIILVVAIFLSKSGLLQIQTEAVKIGVINREREIIWQQCEWIRSHYDSFQNKIPKPKGYNEWRGKYVSTRIIAQWMEWIYFNHFEDNPGYIEIKSDRIMQIILEETVREEFHSEEFEKLIRDDVKLCIKKLINIRKIFKKTM